MKAIDSKDEFTVSPADLTWELVSKFGVKSEIYLEAKATGHVWLPCCSIETDK